MSDHDGWQWVQARSLTVGVQLIIGTRTDHPRPVRVLDVRREADTADVLIVLEGYGHLPFRLAPDEQVATDPESSR